MVPGSGKLENTFKIDTFKFADSTFIMSLILKAYAYNR
jgi:hypothetical protein